MSEETALTASQRPPTADPRSRPVMRLRVTTTAQGAPAEFVACPACDEAMRLWANYYRCPRCGYKESCCF